MLVGEVNNDVHDFRMVTGSQWGTPGTVTTGNDDMGIALSQVPPILFKNIASNEIIRKHLAVMGVTRQLQVHA